MTTRVNTAVGRKFHETMFERSHTERDGKGELIITRVKLPTAEREYMPGGRPLSDEEIGITRALVLYWGT
jgi:hypothetical protein